MKRFLSRLAPWRSSKRFCAVDFDSRQVRIVHATQAGAAARLLKLATAQVPPGLDVENAEAVGEFLGRTLDQMGLRGAWVLMNVPRSKAVLKPLTLPPVAHPGELAGMVLYQAEKELTFRPEDTVVDFTSERHYGVEPAGSDEPQGEHVLAAAVRRGVVEHYQRIAKAAGARLLRLGLRPYANMRCLEAYGGQEPGARLALVHLTADETEIDILSGNSLTFSRAAIVEVPFGGEGAEAELQEAVQVIVTEVARSLQSYMTVDRDHRIDSVLLAGGTGIESRVAAELDKRLAVQCQTFDPSQALGLEEPGAGASGFISALGLAVGQAGRAEPPFDFLNPKRPVVRRDLTRIAVLGGVAAGVLALVGAFAVASVHLYRAKAEVRGLTEQFNTLNTENRKVTALAKRVETIDGWVRSGRPWLEQWAYLSSVFPTCADAYVTALKTNQALPEASVTFTVRAKSNDAINELGQRLALAGYDFHPGQVTTTTDPYGYQYSTSVKILVGAEMKVDVAELAPEPRPEDDVSAAEFGKPVARAEAPKGEAPRPAMSPADALKAWQGRFEQLMRERPPSEQVEANNAWRAKRDEMYRERMRLDQELRQSSSRSNDGRHR